MSLFVNMKLKIILSVCLLWLHSSSSNIYQPRVDLELEIQAIYSGQLSQIGIRGNGLGLNFETSSDMIQISDQVWSYTIKFETDEFGFRCGNCPDESESFIPHGDKLKLKFYALLNGTEFPSLGSTFEIPLPVSKVSSFFPDTPIRTFNPYFFSKEGHVFSLDINSHDPILGTRNVVAYVPPGVLENPKIVYDRLFIIDLSKDVAQVLKPMLDETFLDGVITDTIIIGFGDWKPDALYQDISIDRANLLTPVVGDNVACKEGTPENRCNGCVPENVSTEEYLYWMTTGGCGITVEYGGFADSSLDFLLGPVHFEINTYLMMNYGVLTTNDKSGTFLLGFSLGGLISCYAGWTRPSVFSGVGCQSPSFWWPTSVENETFTPQFYLPKLLLEEDVGPRPYLDVLIDVGGEEQDDIFQMVTEAELVYEILGAHPSFTKDVNLWLDVYPGQNHTAENWIGRLYNPLVVLLRDRD